MLTGRRLTLMCATLAAVLGLSLWVSLALAYVEAPMSLGDVISQSTNVVLMRVESVDKQKNLIIYRKVRDVKGKHPTDLIKHNIGRGGLRPDEWKPQMQWAEPGKMAVFFHNGGASETCIGTWWYQAYAGGEWWNHSHGEPFLLRSYCGAPEKLANLVGEINEGREVVVPCMVDGNKEDLHNRRAKIQRLKASLKLKDYNPKRDFVGWGGEDFRRIQGLPGFTHISTIGRVDPEAQAISVIDFDSDGKPDVCLVGASRISLLQNAGEALSEFPLAGGYGARSAVWADYNGDGKPDLLLATPKGLKLLTNLGTSFRDDSHLLPEEPFPSFTAAAWIDYDGDGRPDILVANGYHGLRLYRNTGDAKGKRFVDVSSQAGFGPEGQGAGVKGDTLTVCDVNGDGRADFLFGGQSGMLFLNSKNDKGETVFTPATNCGITLPPGKVGPVFADFNNDGRPDLVVPYKGGIKLFRNDGKGTFTDVTGKSGDLAKFTGWATSAAWGDFDNDGKLDLVVGCLKGPNRFFRNKGDGVFEDATEEVGLGHTIFNTQAVALVDLNRDGILDMIFNNEGQESVVLLGSNGQAGKRIPLTVNIAAKTGVTGSSVQVTDKSGRLHGTQQISGGDGRGGQHSPVARFTLEPGTYILRVRYSSGASHTREVTVGSDPVNSKIDDDVPKTE